MTTPLNDLNTVSGLLKSGYAKAAVAAYRAHKQATDPSWLEGKGSRWGRQATAQALVWWIQHEVKLGSDDRITGRDGKSYPRYPVSERLAEHVVMLRANGLTMREIAAQLGCSAATVHRILKP